MERRECFNGVKFQWVELAERISQWSEESRGYREECEQKRRDGKQQNLKGIIDNRDHVVRLMTDTLKNQVRLNGRKT